MQNRYKSWALWAAVAAFGLDLSLYAHIITVGDSEAINALVHSFLGLLALAGIINNPTNPDGL